MELTPLETEGVNSIGTSFVPILSDTGCFLINSEYLLDFGTFISLCSLYCVLKAFYIYVDIKKQVPGIKQIHPDKL